MADQKFKSKVQLQGGASLPAQTASTVPVIDSSKNLISSTITDTELGFLSGIDSNIQDQLDDKADSSDVDALIALSGVAAGEEDLGAFTGDLIPDDSTIKEALQALETSIEGLPDPITYEGTWDASTNTPELEDGIGNNGDLYQVTVAGTVDFGAGDIIFNIGDKVVYNGTIWEKWDMTDAVTSVNGQTGEVSLDTDDIAEGTALYFTDERAQDSIGTILESSDTVTLTYDDDAPSIVAEVIAQMSITSDASGIKLDGDEASPGNVKYYGTDGSGIKGFHDVPAVGSAGDIQETEFSAANNVAVAADVTGLLFDDTIVRSFKALVSVQIDATAELFEVFELLGINKGTAFDMSVSGVGDESGIVFTITSSGQVQYTSANYDGFVAADLLFRAITTTI